MKRSIFIFLTFLCYVGTSQNFNETDFWKYLCNVVEEKAWVDFFIKDEYQSTFSDFIKNVNFQTDSLEFLNRIKKEYQSSFASNDNIEFQFDMLEVVFNSKETVVIMAEHEKKLDKVKLKTSNKLEKFIMYVDKYNELPLNTFQYLNYKFYVLRNSEKWMHITYKINSEIEIIDKTVIDI